jgi:hypothetical protein
MPASAATGIEAYSRAPRAAAGALVALSRASPPLLLAAVLLGSEVGAGLPPLLDAVLALSLLPALAAHLVGRALRCEVAVLGADLVLRRRGLRVELPLASIERVLPWRAPLPRPGFGLGLRSGARLRWSLAAPDPAPLLRALADAGVGAARDALRHPMLVYAEARAAAGRPLWNRWPAKVALFALLPGGVAFYAHQHIAYGGLLGEYYLLGPGAYVRTALLMWLHAGLLLALYAAGWRALVELAALAAAWRAPSRAAALRRAAEGAAAALYYASVPALLALRFLA